MTHGGVHAARRRHRRTHSFFPPPHLTTSGWQQTIVAFLAEKQGRSGSRRTVESYARMLWPFLTRVGSPDRVTTAHLLAWAHGVGASGPRAIVGHCRCADRLPVVVLPVPDPDEPPDSGTSGRQALVQALFARLDVLGYERLEYELTPDAVDLGLDAAVRQVIELRTKVDEFGRGERI